MKLSKIVKNILLDVSKEMKKKDNLTIIRMDILNPIIKEIIDELNAAVQHMSFVILKMKEYKFSDDLCNEVINNWNNLRKDLKVEGVEFE